MMLLSRVGSIGLVSKTSHPLWASVFQEKKGKILNPHLDLCEHEGQENKNQP